jgi:hypothetical protein
MIINPTEGTPTFPLDIITKLKTVQNSYSSNLALRNYASIPNDMLTYLRLLLPLTDYKNTISTEYLNYAMTIVTHCLRGSMNVRSLFDENVSLKTKVMILQGKIEEIIANKNNYAVISGPTVATGELGFSRTIKLAPLYRYYIAMFGMPAYGVGFDDYKLGYVLDFLDKNGINPYGGSNSVITSAGPLDPTKT